MLDCVLPFKHALYEYARLPTSRAVCLLLLDSNVSRRVALVPEPPRRTPRCHIIILDYQPYEAGRARGHQENQALGGLWRTSKESPISYRRTSTEKPTAGCLQPAWHGMAWTDAARSGFCHLGLSSARRREVPSEIEVNVQEWLGVSLIHPIFACRSLEVAPPEHITA